MANWAIIPGLARNFLESFPRKPPVPSLKPASSISRRKNKHGERFGELLTRTGLEFLAPYTLKAAR